MEIKQPQFTTILEDYEDEFIGQFIAAMDTADAMKMLTESKAKEIKTLLKVSAKRDLVGAEIVHIYRLVKQSMEKPKVADNPYAMLIDKQQAIVLLNKDINKPGTDPKTRGVLLAQLADLNGWNEDKDTEALIESNEKLMETLNKLFTVQEQEYLAFSMLDEVLEIESGADQELEDSSVLSKVEIE
jgi:hypothetical protein